MIIAGPRWTQKSPRETLVDLEHPWVRGMQGFYALNEGTGGLVADGMRNLNLTATGFGTTNPWGVGSQVGLQVNAASQNANKAIPASLQPGLPISIAWAGRFLGTPTNSSQMIGALYANTNTNPYVSFALQFSSGTTMGLFFNSGGTSENVASGIFASGVDMVVSGTITSSLASLYQHGLLKNTLSGPFSNPTYSATANISIGPISAVSRNLNAITYWAAWSNTAWPASVHAAIGSSVNAIWDIMEPDPDYSLMQLAPTSGSIHSSSTTVFLPRRTSIDSYRGSLALPAQPDLYQPPGDLWFPDSAKAAQRSVPTSYVGALSFQALADATQPPGIVGFPAFARPPTRSQATAYAALSFQAQGDASQPPGFIVAPSSAPAARRAATYDISLWQQPFIVLPSTPGRPEFPDFARGFQRSTADVYSVSLHAGPPSLVPIDLGRYRLGDTVVASFPLSPQSQAPTVTFTGPSSTVTTQLTTRDGATWNLSQFLGTSYQTGTYSTTIGGIPVYFEVVAGGDYGGKVVALFAVQNVNGWQVLAQLQSGQLVMGVNPRLTED